MGTKLLKAVNKCFKLPSHPFNLNNEGKKTYAEWQYEKGEETIRFFLSQVTPAEMFGGKIVLDVGCGAGGKTLYYAAQGVSRIYGMDVVPYYREQSMALAKKLGLADKFEFVLADAAKTGFEDGGIDVIIMNDAMEHVSDPDGVLRECYRILKPGGRLYVNFPPYDHPFGAHLSDAIGIPWVHRFFSDDTLIQGYKELVAGLPDGQERVDFRISKDASGKEYFSYINKMTIKRFNRIRRETPLKTAYYAEIPLRGTLRGLSKFPLTKEMFTKMVVCIFEK